MENEKENHRTEAKGVLLGCDSFDIELFANELKNYVEEFVQSKQADGDKYFLAVIDHMKDLAMLLIDENNTFHANEDARALLKNIWSKAFKSNVEKLIPQIVRELNEGYLFAAGLKAVKK